MWQVYVLKSARKRWYYIGSTNRLEIRLREHNFGKVLSTKNHIPLELVHTIDFPSEMATRKYEQKLKGKRIEKERLIRQIEKE